MDTLKEQMRSLRLPGMASAWETMLETRSYTSITLGDGLKILLQAERDTRRQNRTQRLLRNARFRYQATVESIFFDNEKGRNKDLLNRLACCDFIRSGESVMVTGAAGTGKSHIATALGTNACLAGHRVLYSGMSKLLEMINKARLCGSITNCFEKLADLDLLIVDDFGMRKLQGQQLLDFMEVIEDRHGRKSTIIASQLPVADWYEVLEQNPTIADAIMDRFAKTAHRIELKGESFRK